MTTFSEILPRLAATYEAGRLVPFLGSGMSVPVCTDWWTFVHGLECEAIGNEMAPFPKTMTREELVRRANNAVRSLKAKPPGAFEPAVRKALFGAAKPGIPQQTQSLAQLSWPLVLSTNYDNCYPAALQKSTSGRLLGELTVVGRGVEDCQRVLNSLSVAGPPLLWALQGYLDGPHPLTTSTDPSALRRQLIVGHEEYRRVTYRDLHFRRAFAEVFRERSLLFLGAGIQETYLQELFGEVLEYYGPSTRPHYAFIQKGEVDPEFMRARFQIIVVEYPEGKHECVWKRLDKLAETVRRGRHVPVSWSWGRIEGRKRDWTTSVADLEVVRGPLPTKPAEGECLAVSAGGEGSNFYFSKGIWRLMTQWGVVSPEPSEISGYLGEYPAQHVFAVRARRNDERGLVHIYNASLELFDRAAPKYRCIRMQLLAAGGVGTSDTAPDWRVRNYPERFSFIQTVRAWGTWRERHPDIDCRLALHVVLEAVYPEIASGRIDVLELLNCRDLRFFVEVVSDGGDLERRLFERMPDTTLGDIARELQLAAAHWTLEVTPPPNVNDMPFGSLLEEETRTLEALGVVPGSTLHFRRLQLNGGPAGTPVEGKVERPRDPRPRRGRS